MSQLTLDGPLEKLKEVLSQKLGLVSSHCNKDAVPKFFKAHSVPYEYKENIDKEIDRLIDRQMIV